MGLIEQSVNKAKFDIATTNRDALIKSRTDSSNTVSFSPGDKFSIGHTSSGTPTNSLMRWSAVQYGVDFATFRQHLIYY